MDLEINYVPFPLGHEIRNVDVRKVDDETFKQIEAAYDRYGVVVIRGQSLTPQQQVDFSKRFGSLDRFVWDEFNMRDLPEVFVLSNIVVDGKPLGLDNGGRYWHSDMWITDNPPRGSMLYAVEVPHAADGKPLGDTCFASTAEAYDTLSDELKAKIENLSAVFSSQAFAEYVGYDKPKDANGDAIAQAQEKTKDVVITHPLVRIHPRTGRKCLYVVQGAITHIVGLEPAESRALLDQLMNHVIRQGAVYRHSWKVGDIVMWDNYSAVHCAIGDFEWPQRRLMHRTTLSVKAAGAAAVAAGRAGATASVTM
jgi:taurine dioxygenase